MPTAVTYPGVYIEEIPSGVRAIAGVETSIAAFVGYTSRGPTNEPVQIFSFADFERRFGGLDRDSELSYAVSHFFLNGGAKAWIVRVATGATAGQITMGTDLAGGPAALQARARSEGVWGNGLVVEVDYATSNPARLFNLTVLEVQERNGQRVAVRTETHRNLSMNSASGNYAVNVVNAASQLIELSRAGDATDALDATEMFSTSGVLDDAILGDLDDDHRRLGISIDGGQLYEFDIFPAGGSAPAGADLEERLNNLGALIETAVENLEPGSDAFANFTCGADSSGTRLRAVSGTTGPAPEELERASVNFFRASMRDASTLLGLGVANGGIERSAAASMRPAASGTWWTRQDPPTDFSAIAAAASLDVDLIDAAGNTLSNETLALWPDAASAPEDLAGLRAAVQVALSSSSRLEVSQAQVLLVGEQMVIVPGGDDPGVRIETSGPTIDGTDLSTGSLPNIGGYQLGIGPTVQAQSGAVPGSDGTPPQDGDGTLPGSRASKSGIFALEDTDLFNILNLTGQSSPAILSSAVAYGEERRAFVLLDMPSTVSTMEQARDWMQDPANSGLLSANAAAYFPRIKAADPLDGNRLRTLPNSGAVAGLYARTDGARGVWKAPAGTEAGLRGVQALDYVLTDPENGVLNPLGLNSLRLFPAFGPVAWGARTLYGSDARASEWKYIPVRRLALFIEESLYRGTQWVVFEPNDEPLWAQIRLNVGAFMNNLFRQGAFQGTTPREAYLVRCDSSTTTQDDINLGIVNIIVGFAPLKPAEFVIIKLQQLAGQAGA